MNMKLRDTFVRNSRMSVLLECFLIASVTSVLVIRFFLAATGDPQLGGGGLHISHMLWGGLDMLVALVLSLAFLGRRMQTIVALLGGIGFGTFIDELGKFITSDNNYFFQPTIALIYIIFIVLLLSFRLLESSPYLSEQERLANALNLLKEGVLRGLREQDKKEILLLLRASDSREFRLNLLADAIEQMPEVPASLPGLFQRFADSPQFVPTAIVFFIGYTLLLMVFGITNLLGDSVTTSVVEIGWLASSCLSTIMILIGILFLRRSRLVAYTWFKRAVLVSIFLTQVFLFYMQPLGALEALLMNLIVLAILNSLTRHHQRDAKHKILVQSSTS